MAAPLVQQLSKALGARVTGSRPLAGGDIADVSLLRLENHTEVVAKRPRMDQPDTTAIEAMMLTHLAKHSPLPVPKVLFQKAGILVISYIPNKGSTDSVAAAESVAQHTALLHQSLRPGKPLYGFEQDTVIGPLPQRNKQMTNWVDFFRENRLNTLSRSCLNVNRFGPEMAKRIEGFAANLKNFLPMEPPSALLHGDLWGGNILIDGDRAAGFIDPAISYGHHEMDLAFIDLMGGLDPAFWPAYETAHGIGPGFHEERKAIYQLWPLLVHVRLFGGGYIKQVETILERFGY
jgi:fructosamine-3-kinase